jgi:hypothetical protein
MNNFFVTKWTLWKLTYTKKSIIVHFTSITIYSMSIMDISIESLEDSLDNIRAYEWLARKFPQIFFSKFQKI